MINWLSSWVQSPPQPQNTTVTEPRYIRKGPYRLNGHCRYTIRYHDLLSERSRIIELTPDDYKQIMEEIIDEVLPLDEFDNLFLVINNEGVIQLKNMRLFELGEKHIPDAFTSAYQLNRVESGVNQPEDAWPAEVRYGICNHIYRKTIKRE